ncbi:DUF4277 domain-containing protein [Streptomyces sp. NPDC005486]|uniref:DUF4277 domain-containing protein n=1 Tax=Streptomyces sp. NPDC005486 TaxID=3155345 RepID=UPI0033B5B47F
MDQHGRHRARYVAASIEKQLGALPVIADYCRRLDLAGIIDRACPIRDIADLTHGQVIETLVANRLTSPAPLARVAGWAGMHAVEDVFGIDPALLKALARLRLIPAANGQPPGIPQPPPLQARLLDLLGVDPTRPR